MPQEYTLNNAHLSARFVQDEQGWRPDWIYAGETPVLRFKDHEWLSLGRVVTVTHATQTELAEDRAVFGGEADVLGCRVRWQVELTADGSGYYGLTTTITPDETIELVEAFTFLETPYQYDGSERQETILGANPATVWDGAEQLTPPVWNNPAWAYAREEAARMTYPTALPVAVQALRNGDGAHPLFVSVLSNFDRSDFDDIFITPTRTIRDDASDYWDFKRDKIRGYKYTVSAVNWSGAIDKDPNVAIEPTGGVQAIEFSAATALPGGDRGRWLMQVWERAYRLHNDGQLLPINEVVAATGADWLKAGDWLEQSLAVPGSTAMVSKEMGSIDYVIGTRPLSNYCYGPGWRFYFQKRILGSLHYRAKLLHQAERKGHLDALEAKLLEEGYQPYQWPNGKLVTHEPFGGYARVFAVAPESAIGQRADPRPWKDEIAGRFRTVMDNPDMPYGMWAKLAYQLLPAMQSKELAALWVEPMEGVNHGLMERFWDFGYMPRSNAYINGGQASASIFLSIACVAGQLYRFFPEARWAEVYARALNYAIGWGYHVHNRSDTPDLDYRGLAHASMAGRDQQADIPPMENDWLIEALAYLDVIPAAYHQRAWLDCLWLARQTAMSQYPAARTTKKLFTKGYGRKNYPIQEVATERFYVENYPYMAYENPVDQTLIATYQSLMGLRADIAFGGRLAEADPRLLCFVPRAGRHELAEVNQRQVLVYNPNPAAIAATVALHFPGAASQTQSVELEPGAQQWITATRG